MDECRVRFSPEMIVSRLPVWKALSDLFLDTELLPRDYRYVASQLQDSGLDLTEIEGILWDEVFPALGDNLRIVSGEWADFSEEWLRERIPAVANGSQSGMGVYGLMSRKAAREIIAEAWAEVCKYLRQQENESADRS